jgi:glutaredoxin
MFDALRARLHQAITSPKGESASASRQVAQSLNDLLGQPLCSQEELERRRAGARKLEELRSRPRPSAAAKREPAPVMVYFEKDRNARELIRIKEILGMHGIEPKLLDVTDDMATIAFVTREAKCERDELPVVFVAGSALGGFRALAAADTRGELKKAVFGA